MRKFHLSALDEALIDVGYQVIDQFLPKSDYQALQSYVKQLAQTDAFRAAKIGRVDQTHHQPLIRTDSIYWLNDTPHDDVPHPLSLHPFYHAIETLRQFLNQTLFLGLEQFEAHFAVYQPGQFYKKHVDQFTGNQDRRISCVYYLNEAWQPEHAGELCIYPKQHPVVTISPRGNRLVCFNSSLLHEVLPAQNIRYSITGWLKTRGLLPI